MANDNKLGGLGERLKAIDLKAAMHSPLGSVLLNVLVAYLVWMLSRVAFFVENWSTFAPYMSWDLGWSMFKGSLLFDTSALLYVNAIYIVLTLFPLHWKEVKVFHKIMKWVFVITNSIAVAMNLGDAVYVQYTGKRCTMSVFNQFGNEDNLGGIIFTEFINHWYLVLVFAVLVFLLWRMYTNVRLPLSNKGWRYYLLRVLTLLVLAPAVIIGMRGSVTAGTKPITSSNALAFVNRPIEATVVLNTPFTMIRSIGRKAYITPSYFDPQKLSQVYDPVITPVPDSLSTQGKNVMIIIVESMGKEYIGSLNPDLDNGNYAGYMPFVDSLIPHSLTFKYSYANGRISIDAMPSILSSIPMFVESFVLTPASFNEVRGLPSLLAPKGYSNAFFHGGHNITMGFNAFSKAVGYEQYYGLDEYCADPNYGGMDDFDGKWAIWDEPFLQFTLDKMNTLKEPFVATVFTASSHHPYNVPEQYANVFRDEGGQPIHKTVRYTDMALEHFFDRAAQQDWYNNTIFVLVADHTNLSSHEVYKTDLGLYSIPIIFFAPDGSLPTGVRDDVVVNQIDILPSLLHLLGYDKQYLAFGKDIFGTDPAQTRAVNYNNGIYQMVKGDYMLQFDGERTRAMYQFKSDPLLKQNLVGNVPCQNEMEQELKAMIQQYMTRMNQNNLTIK